MHGVNYKFYISQLILYIFKMREAGQVIKSIRLLFHQILYNIK